MENNGVPLKLRPSNGLFVDVANGLIRTSQNGGLRGTAGYVWGVNTAGDGQAMAVRGARVIYEAGKPILVVDPPPTQAPVLKIATGLVCVPNADGTSWSIPFMQQMSGVVVYRNGLRQSAAPTTTNNPYQPDYSLSDDKMQIIPNPNFPWSVQRIDGSAPDPDLIVADVYYY